MLLVVMWCLLRLHVRTISAISGTIFGPAWCFFRDWRAQKWIATLTKNGTKSDAKMDRNSAKNGSENDPKMDLPRAHLGSDSIVATGQVQYFFTRANMFFFLHV